MNTLNFTFNFNAPVGQNIAHVDHLEAHFDKDMTMQVVDTASLAREEHGLPEALLTDEARALLAKLVEAGMIDDEWQPVGLSNAEKGTLAEYITERLSISAKWKLWGNLWGMNPETLRTAKARGLEQEKTWAFRTRLDAL
jgi:hypothetical protein